MDQKYTPTIKNSAGALERVLEEFESIDESEDCLPLRKSAEGLVEILALLHGLDPDLLSAKARARIAARVEKARTKPGGGRNSFNTGF